MSCDDVDPEPLTEEEVAFNYFERLAWFQSAVSEAMSADLNEDEIKAWNPQCADDYSKIRAHRVDDILLEWERRTNALESGNDSGQVPESNG